MALARGSGRRLQPLQIGELRAQMALLGRARRVRKELVRYDDGAADEADELLVGRELGLEVRGHALDQRVLLRHQALPLHRVVARPLSRARLGSHPPAARSTRRGRR